MLLGVYTFLPRLQVYIPYTTGLQPWAKTHSLDPIFASALKSVMEDINESDPVRGALQIGIFLVVFAVTPVFLVPLSENSDFSNWKRHLYCLFVLVKGFAKTVDSSNSPFSHCYLVLLLY